MYTTILVVITFLLCFCFISTIYYRFVEGRRHSTHPSIITGAGYALAPRLFRSGPTNIGKHTSPRLTQQSENNLDYSNSHKSKNILVFRHTNTFCLGEGRRFNENQPKKINTRTQKYNAGKGDQSSKSSLPKYMYDGWKPLFGPSSVRKVKRKPRVRFVFQIKAVYHFLF